MANRTSSGVTSRAVERRGITKLMVEGFKSLVDRTEIEVRPLTILAGSNSSGKSSALQPLLLLKQTLAAQYDPGPLLLDGPHVRFTAAAQMFSKVAGRAKVDQCIFGVEVDHEAQVTNRYATGMKSRLSLIETSKVDRDGVSAWRVDMDDAAIRAQLSGRARSALKHLFDAEAFELRIERWGGFLRPVALDRGTHANSIPVFWTYSPVEDRIGRIIHVPGLRGNPTRTYKTTAVGPTFPGTFEAYVASIVQRWQDDRDPRLQALGQCLDELGLTWKVEAKRVDDTQVELRVGRLSRPRQGGAKDLVSIADVGFGLSQTLPVVVALLSASRGQLVYIEQPEIHLHPRAQVAMARLIASAATRGVRVIAETHSALLLLGVQSLVAEDVLNPRLVKLHWFQRVDDGSTRVTSRDIDEAGAFGDWPEDFGDVMLEAQSRYLDHAEGKLAAS